MPDVPAPETLPASLHDPVRRYLAEGVRSARVICELLIRDHGAYAGRYVTGKPKLYAPVCLFIERAFPESAVESRSGSDRMYRL